MMRSRRTRTFLIVASVVAVVALLAWSLPAVGSCCAQLVRQASAPATITVLEDASDADRVAAVEVSNYPTLGAAGSRITEDPAIVSEALGTFGSASFSRWDGEAARLLVEGLFPPPAMTGGYFSSLVFLDDSDELLATVNYDSDKGIYLWRNGCIYVADDQEALQGLLDDLISRAREQDEEPLATGGARTWWYPDDWASR